MRNREKVTLHFDLSHCPQDVEFTLQAGGGKSQVLTAYKDAPEKLAEHMNQNKALAMIPAEHHPRITHFVEDAELYADALSVRRVEYPSIDDHPLPEIALVFVHIPTAHQRQAIRQTPANTGKIPHHMTLAHYGVPAEAVNSSEIEEVHLHADRIKPPFETAKSIVFHHPEIGSVNSLVAKKVFDKHIKQTQEFHNLSEYIQKHPPESGQAWYKKTYATWINPDTGKEEPVPANVDLKYKDGKKVNWPVNPETKQPSIPLYDLTDEYNSQDPGVIGAAGPVVHQVLQATKNDETLNGQLWTKQNGTTNKARTHVPPAPAPPPASTQALDLTAKPADEASRSARKGFAIKNVTSSYGVFLYDKELKYDPETRMLSFPVKNWPNRYLSAYVQLKKSDGTPIKRKDIEGWQDDLPDFLQKAFEPSETKNYLDWISAGNSVFGVPVPFLSSKTELKFLFPEEATTAEVLLGGLGVAGGFKDWDGEVDVAGVLGTGLISYGFSALSMALTVYVVNPFLAGLDKDAKFGVYAVAGVIGVTYAVTEIGVEGGKGAKKVLSKLATMAVGFIFSFAVKKVLQRIYREAIAEIIAEAVAEITAEEALGEIPVAGWALKVASVAADIASLTATTVECLLSPATYKLEILHTMDLNVTVKPDPVHGTQSQKPVWPLVSDHYVIQVKYPKGNNQEGGTSYTMAGPMPGRHDQPIEVTFDQIPAGGKVEVVANIYSENNWQAGRWDSGWINADPKPDDTLAVSGNIREKLVPLTADTTYSQKQRLAYSDEQKHYWQVTKFSISADVAAGLDAGDVSGAMRKAFQDNGNALSAELKVTIETQGSRWKLVDKDAGITYNISKKQIFDRNGQTLYELEVQNVTHAAPGLPEAIEDCGPDGHRLCDRMNITINNKEYQLGYTWRASGQNLPRDNGTTPDNGQMYAFQSISTLGQPQDAIIEPGRGFSNPSYIAFDQFGLATLFDLDLKTYQSRLNEGGPVSAELSGEFSKFGLNLPKEAQVRVATRNKAWQIGLPDQKPLFELRVVTIIKDGNQKDIIGVYSWPVPKLDNFYLDSRSYTPQNKLYYLRGVEFATGQTSFDYDTKKSWGCFQDVTIKDLAVHPQGYVVGADYDNHKLLALRLPAEAVDDKDAPIAMPLSGEGLREGLMSMPVALTITAEGRILILEEGNQRIQAFDVKGNPVPCFAADQKPFQLDAGFIGVLDARSTSADLIQAFQKNVKPLLAPIFSVEQSSVAALNNGQVDPQLSEAFLKNGYAKKRNGGPLFSVEVTKKGELWLVTDMTTKAVYDVRLMTDLDPVMPLTVFHGFAFGIDVQAPGQEWLINDMANALTFDVRKPPKGNDLTVQRLVSTMPLREHDQQGISYLDVAVETKGYIYVLSKRDQGGTPEYRLDIYNPDGSALLDKPQTGVNAAKLTVDQWRSLFTLNFDKLPGPGERTEPGISEWEPSTTGKPCTKS